MPEPVAGKLWRFVAATLGYALLLALVYVVHVRWFRVDVVLYSAVADALLAVAIAALPVFAWRGFTGFNRFEKLQMLLAWSLLGYAYAISVPTVIDRSLSFYMLEKIQQRGGGIRLDYFPELFTSEYPREHHLVDVRLTEQLASGTVRMEDGCVRLTERGERMATFSRFFRRYLLPRQRLLRGSYTDALTDVLHQGEPVGGRCAPQGDGK
jgi:hypothetical protein